MDTRISPAIGLAQAPKQASTALLRVGEIVDARVLTQSGKHLSLRIGQQVLSAVLTGSQVKIARGAKFEVVQLEPVPVLKVRNPSQIASPTKASLFVRGLLPTQRPLQALFDTLRDTKNDLRQNTNSGVQHAKYELLVRTVTNLEKHALALGDIARADGLRTAIKNSGVFLENQLSQLLTSNGKYLGFGDLKATLLRARARLSSVINLSSPRAKLAVQTPQTSQLAPPSNVDESLSSLFKAVEVGLARIETLQLANHTLATAGQNNVYLELPIRIGNQFETIRLLIEHEQSSSEENILKTQSASIYLEVVISDSESVQAKVSVTGEKLSITLWSESERIQERLRGSAANLDTALTRSAVDNATVVVQRFHNNMLDPAQLFTDLVSETA